jgi:8-oxo-dGTP pyrophosphatase MutT (NUDIX family)
MSIEKKGASSLNPANPRSKFDPRRGLVSLHGPSSNSMLFTAFPKAFSHYKSRRLKVYGVVCISSNNRFLLVRGRKTGIWSFPKGHLSGNETSQECALRELREETGIQIPYNTFYLSRKLFAGEYYFYRVEEEPVVVPSDSFEISEGGWFTLEEMRTLHCNADIINLMNRIEKGNLLFDEGRNKIDIRPICNEPTEFNGAIDEEFCV